MTNTIRVALIGTGRAGLVHGRNFAAGVPGACFVAVADPSEEARAAAVKELAPERVFSSAMEAVTDDSIDAVVVATPTSTHAEIVVAALEHGKHVLCEKPIASTVAEGREIAAAAERSGRTYMIGFSRRSDASFRRLAERIESGDIGKPLFVRSTGRGPGLVPSWALDAESSGGLLGEVNSHDVDAIRWLSGQEATRVFAVGRAAKRPDLAAEHPEFYDLAAVTIELTDGAIAQFDAACPADYGYDARVEVYGSEGMLMVGRTAENSVVMTRRDGIVADPIISWRTLFHEAYREEDRNFIAACLGQESARTSAEDGIQVLRTVMAANRSMRTGMPVSLEEVPQR